MFSSLFIVRLFFLAGLFLLFDNSPPVVHADHCPGLPGGGPTGRHSCPTRTQTWQPGETIDRHPGGAKGRGTTSAQGTGSNQSVHCQIEADGKCHCGPRRGTGRNIPCRPELETTPQPDLRVESCPSRYSALTLPGVVLVANQAPESGGGLWVAGTKIESAEAVGLQGLTKRRKEIFEAMRCHENRAFRFADGQRLADTIELRAKIIERMEARYKTTDPQPQFYCGLEPPSPFEVYPEPRASIVAGGRVLAARSRNGVTAHDAIRIARSGSSRIDCHAGMQWVVLDAATELLRKKRFDTVHPVRLWPHFVGTGPGPGRHAIVGLGVPVITDETEFVRGQPVTTTMRSNARYTSLAKHLVVIRYDGTGRQNPRNPAEVALARLKGTIRIEDMVPGDWAYLRNVLDYPDAHPGGEWAGENAFYLYERRFDGRGADRRRPSQKRVVAGFGLRMFMTEDELRQELADAFNDGRIFRGFGIPIPTATIAFPGNMLWTRLGAPVLDDSDPSEAGFFIR
jgi:hypothetical protein